MASIELRVCIDGIPRWGFVDKDMFYPVGSGDSSELKKLASEAFESFQKGDKKWQGVPLSQCGPNLDIPN